MSQFNSIPSLYCHWLNSFAVSRCPAIVSQWHQEPKEKVVSLLLSHLPLLQPRNSEAKCEYMKLLQKVLSHTIESSLFAEESRQLLSYALIHPATTLDDRTSLAMWLNHLEEHLSGGYAPRIPPSPYNPHQVSDEWPGSAEVLDPGNAWHDKSSSTSPAGQNGHMPFLSGMSSPINTGSTGRFIRAGLNDQCTFIAWDKIWFIWEWIVDWPLCYILVRKT